MILWLTLNGFLLAIAYLLGSTPTGYWIGWWLRGFDIREHGSKSTGATNVLRVMGKGPALVVLAMDILKAVAAIVLVRGCYALEAMAQLAPTTVTPTSWLPWMVTLAGFAALFGHGKSIWLMVGKARNPDLATGGKSVASALGVLLAIYWPIGLATLGIFATILAISRIVSLSSMLASISISILMVVTHQPLPYCLFGVVGTLYILLRHRANIQRLLEGTEPRLGQSSMGNQQSPVSEQ